MNEVLIRVTEVVVFVIDAMALIIIFIGTLKAFWSVMRAVFAGMDGHARRITWLKYARVLVAGLTFQLASDILESAITTSWDSVGRLAAIAVIRTFLNYFLERDVEEVRERDHEAKRATTNS